MTVGVSVGRGLASVNPRLLMLVVVAKSEGLS